MDRVRKENLGCYNYHLNKDGIGSSKNMDATSHESALAADVFEKFVSASTFKSVLHYYCQICDILRLRPQNIRQFYPKLKSKIRSWRAQAIWNKFDKRVSHRCYDHGRACSGSRVLIIGAGPCGLRSAIEAQMLGAKVVVVEKRDRFSRNNVLHLWPFVIADLKSLGAKKFYGKFCAGSIDHISIRQLQCVLLKAALLLGVEVFEGVSFDDLVEPSSTQACRSGWRARCSPSEHPVNHYEFDALIGADGKRNTLQGFKRKEFRGKLAIAITANFINKHSEQEARVQELSGVAFIFNQKFFKDLYAETGIDLENIVYYKDETHYFVMTAKKQSLLNKGVILKDLPDTRQLLHSNNVDRKSLCEYAREAADFATNYQMPHLDFAVNYYGKPDIAMFDFTSMFAAENASRIVHKNGARLLQCLVGDSLLEPFWPTGSGCARGFLSCFDACWSLRSWSSGLMTPLEVIAERESIYRFLAQTTPENLQKDFSSYTLNPASRYPTVNLKSVLPFQVKHLFTSDAADRLDFEENSVALQKSKSVDDMPKKRKHTDCDGELEALLNWYRKQIGNENRITGLHSFKDGRLFCEIVRRYTPHCVALHNLEEKSDAERCQTAFDALKREFSLGSTSNSVERHDVPMDKEAETKFYLTQIYEILRGEIPHSLTPGYPQKSMRRKINAIEESRDGSRDNESCDAQKPNTHSRLICATKEIPYQNCNENSRNCSNSMEKLEKDRMNAKFGSCRPAKSLGPEQGEFTNLVKCIEDKFKGNEAPSQSNALQKPKDLGRKIGKLEKTDWNLSAIEKKMKENSLPAVKSKRKDRVPCWTKDNYNDKLRNFEPAPVQEADGAGGDKYGDIDASLKRLERKLRDGSTLETGLRGQNKVSNLALQISAKLPEKKQDSQIKPQTNRFLPTTKSDLCYFCETKVFLVEKLTAEGKSFHRQCFKCAYCRALLRPGYYVYDRENRYGGKFFCVPHFGLSQKVKEVKPPTGLRQSHTTSDIITTLSKKSPAVDSVLSADERGATPERVEFENSLAEESEGEADELISEDEWTDRNFGASANELDDDTEYSDLSDEDDCGNTGFSRDAAEKTNGGGEAAGDVFAPIGPDFGSPPNHFHDEFNSGSESNDYGIEADESVLATEGELLEGDDDEDEDDEEAKRARELRRRELDIDFAAPPRRAETSDSELSTEVGSSEEESDTQIDTDSEFGDEAGPCMTQSCIPRIVIDQTLVEESPANGPTKAPVGKEAQAVPSPKYVMQSVDTGPIADYEDDFASRTDFDPSLPNPHTEHLKRLLERTRSSHSFSSSTVASNDPTRKNVNLLQKSSSSADVGNKLKRFMDKISATQKKLAPAPEPSPSMQAFLSLSSSGGVGETVNSQSVFQRSAQLDQFPLPQQVPNDVDSCSLKELDKSTVPENSSSTATESTERLRLSESLATVQSVVDPRDILEQLDTDEETAKGSPNNSKPDNEKYTDVSHPDEFEVPDVIQPARDCELPLDEDHSIALRRRSLPDLKHSADSLYPSLYGTQIYNGQGKPIEEEDDHHSSERDSSKNEWNSENNLEGNSNLTPIDGSEMDSDLVPALNGFDLETRSDEKTSTENCQSITPSMKQNASDAPHEPPCGGLNADPEVARMAKMASSESLADSVARSETEIDRDFASKYGDIGDCYDFEYIDSLDISNLPDEFIPDKPSITLGRINDAISPLVNVNGGQFKPGSSKCTESPCSTFPTQVGHLDNGRFLGLSDTLAIAQNSPSFAHGEDNLVKKDISNAAEFLPTTFSANTELKTDVNLTRSQSGNGSNRNSQHNIDNVAAAPDVTKDFQNNNFPAEQNLRDFSASIRSFVPPADALLRGGIRKSKTCDFSPSGKPDGDTASRARGSLSASYKVGDVVRDLVMSRLSQPNKQNARKHQKPTNAKNSDLSSPFDQYALNEPEPVNFFEISNKEFSDRAENQYKVTERPFDEYLHQEKWTPLPENAYLAPFPILPSRSEGELHKNGEFYSCSRRLSNLDNKDKRKSMNNLDEKLEKLFSECRQKSQNLDQAALRNDARLKECLQEYRTRRNSNPIHSYRFQSPAEASVSVFPKIVDERSGLSGPLASHASSPKESAPLPLSTVESPFLGASRQPDFAFQSATARPNSFLPLVETNEDQNCLKQTKRFAENDKKRRFMKYISGLFSKSEGDKSDEWASETALSSPGRRDSASLSGAAPDSGSSPTTSTGSSPSKSGEAKDRFYPFKRLHHKDKKRLSEGKSRSLSLGSQLSSSFSSDGTDYPAIASEPASPYKASGLLSSGGSESSSSISMAGLLKGRSHKKRSTSELNIVNGAPYFEE